MKTLLVTGGAGFIGGNFVRRALADNKYRIVNLDKLTYAGNLRSLPQPDGLRHVFVRGDIASRRLMAELLENYRPDALLNFAAESHVDRSIDGPAQFVKTNVVGTFRLLEAVLRYWQTLDSEQQKAFRFLHVSTDEVYGSLGATGSSPNKRPTLPTPPTQRARPLPTISSAPGITPSACQY